MSKKLIFGLESKYFSRSIVVDLIEKNSLHKKADLNVDISNLQGTINREFVQRKFANGL